MDKLIIMTHAELELLIQNSVRKVLLENPSGPPKNAKEILNLTEACDYLNLAKQTIYGYTSKREIPFIKKSKILYFRKVELDMWLLEGKQPTKRKIIDNGSIEKF